MTYSPIYKQPKQTPTQKIQSVIQGLLRQPEVQDGMKLVAGLVIFAAAGWYGMPYLAAVI